MTQIKPCSSVHCLIHRKFSFTSPMIDRIMSISHTVWKRFIRHINGIQSSLRETWHPFATTGFIDIKHRRNDFIRSKFKWIFAEQICFVRISKTFSVTCFPTFSVVMLPVSRIAIFRIIVNNHLV